MKRALLSLGLLLVMPLASAHEGTGQHEAISGRIPPKGAWSWTVDEPDGLSYFVDNSRGRQGALRVLEEGGSRATYTVRITPGKDGEPVSLEPQDLTVRFGDKVTWINDDSVAHSLVGQTGVYRAPEPQPKDASAWAIPALAVAILASAAWRRR